MTRLQALSFLVLLGCDSAKPGVEPAALSRVVAVKTDKHDETAELCDVKTPADGARPLVLPALDEEHAPLPSGRLRWVNVWATWCPPCVEELALLTQFSADQAARGKALDLTLISVDASRTAIDEFAVAHPIAKTSLRARDPNAIEAWLSKVGLDSGATLPIHLFVDARGNVRCARTGSIRDTDLPRIQKLLEGF